jgi:phosphatidylserine/phosphatidylglycerophosphate/cardiolipin synthase-like enzyme
MMQTSLVVYVNNDDALLVWTADALDPACRGFAVQRKIAQGDGWRDSTWLDNWAPPGPQAHQVGEHQPSNEWPFRCFSWTDHSVNQGETVQYRVVSVSAATNQPDEASASAWSEAQTVGAPTTTGYSAFFNRGFVISQFVSRYLDQKYPGKSRPDALEAFKTDITNDAESEIRAFLSGLVRPTLLGLLADAKANGGHAYAALFELSDPELLDALADMGGHAHLVLANGSIQAKKKTAAHPAEPTADARKRDENADARTYLVDHQVDVAQTHRFVAPSPLAHNKFMVITDATERPKSVWTGSTNWTPTGLCTQLNNALLCTDQDVAACYLTQWQALRAAGSSHPSALVQSNSTPTNVGTDQPGAIRAAIHFTRAQRHVDLDALADVVNSAKQGVLFLMFMPGAKGVLSYVQSLATNRPDLLVRGVVSTLPNGPEDEHTGNTTTVRTTLVGAPTASAGPHTFEVVQPEGMDHVAAGWAIETTRSQFLSGIGFAIIHSKVLVVDPFSNDPTVVTGSHNFSLSASEDNDENFIIIRGDAALAEAYAVNIDSAWRHYHGRIGNPHPGLTGSAYLQALLTDQQHEKTFWRL